MHYIFRPNDWNQWAKIAFSKINKTIKTCTTTEHVSVAKVMVDNFIIVTALEEHVDDSSLESITRLFWLRLDLQKQFIFETKQKQLV
jgi:hypothetical protein